MPPTLHFQILRTKLHAKTTTATREMPQSPLHSFPVRHITSWEGGQTGVSTFKGRGPPISEVSKRGWREGVGDQMRPKYSKKCPPKGCSPTPKGAQEKGGRKKAGIYGVGGISLRQPPLSANLFETSDNCLKQKVVVFSIPDFLSDACHRVRAEGAVLCKTACFCLLSTFYGTPPSKNPCLY